MATEELDRFVVSSLLQLACDIKYFLPDVGYGMVKSYIKQARK